MPLFGGVDPQKLNDATGLLSAEALEVVSVSNRNQKLWSKLVARVGPEMAVEHAEVGVLMGSIDSTDDVIGEAMRFGRPGV